LVGGSLSILQRMAGKKKVTGVIMLVVIAAILFGTLYLHIPGTLFGSQKETAPAGSTYETEETGGTSPGFIITISPQSTTAHPGEVVTYSFTLVATNGFKESVHLQLLVTAPFFSQTYDLGLIEPPYPKTVEYQFKVPDMVLPGITANGHLLAEGGGKSADRDLILKIT
ncbi:MAG TPA: hypothetical protein VE134_04410, partial [Methanomicrobiales archaeon]|nr:hypothetical protein [Methanomicrobiales archaeon]